MAFADEIRAKSQAPAEAKRAGSQLSTDEYGAAH